MSAADAHEIDVKARLAIEGPDVDGLPTKSPSRERPCVRLSRRDRVGRHDPGLALLCVGEAARSAGHIDDVLDDVHLGLGVFETA